MSMHDKNVTWSSCYSTWHIIIAAAVVIVLKTRQRRQKIGAWGLFVIVFKLPHHVVQSPQVLLWSLRSSSRQMRQNLSAGTKSDTLKYIFYWLAPDTFSFPMWTCTFHFALLILLFSPFVIWMHPVHDTEIWADELIQEDMKLCMAVFICVQKSLSIN